MSTNVIEKIRREVHFMPDVDEVLRAVAESERRSLKSLMEVAVIEFLERKTGKKLKNK